MIDKEFLEYLEGYLTHNRKATFKRVLNSRTRHFTVVLEDIYQPHNSSAVVRTCDIFGVQDLYTIESKYINRVATGVTKGSQNWISYHRYKEDTNNTLNCLSDLKSKGYQIIGTTPHTDSCVLHEFDFTKKTAFVFGAEKDGISEEVKKHADGFLKIPMVGFTESFNISVAVAIILHDVTTRLRNSSLEWELSAQEKSDLYLEWVQKSIKNIDKIKEHYLTNKR